MFQDLARLPIVNPKDVYLSVVTSADNRSPHFGKYAGFHKPSVCIDFECSYWCGAIGRVEVKPSGHIVNEKAASRRTDIYVSTEKHSAPMTRMCKETHIADLSGRLYFSAAVSVSLQQL